MAMTKAEKAHLEELERQIALAKAVAHYDDTPPKPMTMDEIQANLVKGGKKWGDFQRVARGWFCNSHSISVSYGCSTGHQHSTTGDVTTSQYGGRMFRTEADAWRMIRHEKLREIAQTLAKIEANFNRCEADSGTQI